jgi:NAD(P)-dependent dehydrogenase (short-subunit alcohol dehydrogenase family)
MGCVVITGCSSGIGLEAAAAFGGRGDVVLAGVRRPESTTAVDERCAGLPVEPVVLDVTDPASIDRVIRAAIDVNGTIDVLVNNAGIGAIGSFEETDEAVYRQVFETNVFGLIAMVKAVLPSMRAAGSGTIVNVGSIVGRVAVPFQPYYSATKHAVEALTDSIQLETERFGIRTCVVEPGRIPTDFASNLVSERAPEGSPYRPLAREWEAGWAAMPGRERLATAAQVAEVIVAATETGSSRHLPAGDDSRLLIAQRESLDRDRFDAYLREAARFTTEHR